MLHQSRMAIVEHTSFAWMQKDEVVSVSGLSVAYEEYMSMLWAIDSLPQDGTVVLRSTMGELQRILVPLRKVRPTSLCIPDQAAVSATLNFQFDLPFQADCAPRAYGNRSANLFLSR